MLGAITRVMESALTVKAAAPGGDQAFASALAGSMASLAGEYVTPQTALQLSAVWCAVRTIAETTGMLPLDMFEQQGENVFPAPGHPLQFYLHDEPNPEMAAVDYRTAATANLALWGNSYSKIVRMRGGRVAGLWLLPSQLTRAERNRDTGEVQYRYTPPFGGEEILQPEEVLHIRTMSLDGLNGIAPISQLRNAIGLAQALERYGSRFFANGAIPGIILEYPTGALSDVARQNIIDSWKRLYGGADNAHGVGIVEEGIKVSKIGTSPAEAQSTEARKFQILEVARIYRMPPHMLGDMDRASYASIEQTGLEFVTYTLMPWLVMWEQAIKRSLLTRQEKGRYFAAFNVIELLRGDIGSRYSAYATGRQWGWLNSNDVRRMERLNPIGKPGDFYMLPVNMALLDPKTGMPIQPPPQEPPKEPEIPTALPPGKTPPKQLPTPRKTAQFLQVLGFGRNGAPLSKFLSDDVDLVNRADDAPVGFLTPAIDDADWDDFDDEIELKYSGDEPRDQLGRWTSGGGVLKLKPIKKRAWNGTQVETTTELSKLETGALGERIVMQHLKLKGMKDVRVADTGRNNFAVDLVGDHSAIEVKTGLVSNGKSAQQWRATAGQPGKEEAKWLKSATADEKRAWNAGKAAAIIDRKNAALKELSKKLGRNIKGMTVTTIINPDTRTADVFAFKNFHSRIAWGSEQAKKGYVASYKF